MHLGNLENALHLTGLAIDVHRQNGFGARGNRRFEARGVDVVRAGIDIHKDGRRAHMRYGRGRGDKSHGCGDHLVARANAAGQERQL